MSGRSVSGDAVCFLLPLGVTLTSWIGGFRGRQPDPQSVKRSRSAFHLMFSPISHRGLNQAFR